MTGYSLGIMHLKLAAITLLGSALISFTQQPASLPLPMVIAHRGASHDAPENTLSAFNLAWEQNADGIEGDFYLTADGEIVTLHDATFKRTAAVDRKPADMTLGEIRKLDVGSWKDPRFAGERAPTLAEVLAIVPQGKRMLIEIKCGPEILPALQKVIKASDVSMDQLRLICFNAEVVAESKRRMPELKAYWLTSFKAPNEGEAKRPTLEEVLGTLKQCGADGLDARADLDVIEAGFVQALRGAGYEIHFWTVDDPAVARRLVELGADSITTNRPDFVRSALVGAK